MMESKIQSALRLKHKPVAILWADEKPEKALQFKEGVMFGCVMTLFAKAVKGRTAVFDRSSFGCFGGGVGLGFGNLYLNMPGGIECFYHFLSQGNEQWETGKEMGENMKSFVRKSFLHEFMHGEGYVKTPELVQKFVENLPMLDIPQKYVVFKPINELDPDKEEPVSITFVANPDQLSALVVLANYERGSGDNVISPFAAGCQSIGIFSYREVDSENPRAIIGLTDLSSRKYVRNQLGNDLMSFSVPFKMFLEMEGNVEGSFLERPLWKELIKENSS